MNEKVLSMSWQTRSTIDYMKRFANGEFAHIGTIVVAYPDNTTDEFTADEIRNFSIEKWISIAIKLEKKK